MLIEKTPNLLKIAYAVTRTRENKIKKVAEYTALFLEQIADQDEIEKTEVIEKFVKEMESIKNGKQIHINTIKSFDEVPIKI
jgi:hypothetical protein